MIDPVAFSSKQDVEALVSVANSDTGELLQPNPDFSPIVSDALVTLSRSSLPDYRASSSLTHAVILLKLTNQSALAVGLQSFFESTS